jgi:hypothetical protein
VPLGPAPYAPNESMLSKCGSTTFITSVTIRGSRVSSRGLALCRLDYVSDRIFPDLITGEHGPGLIAINPFQQQRGEPVSPTTCLTNARTEISDGVGRTHESAGS